ncbi:MAG: site-2 protease family protein [Chloroflexi bacterium]|nr:site-2 protease family protein [Chloroflexota bacterium]
MLITVASFLLVLTALVLIHEAGHFVTAKLAGVTVQEFGIGFPPRLFGIRWRGTDYTVNLVPLGGFVKLLGEEDPRERGSLASKSIPTRVLILAAGAGMNALLPIVLFTAGYMIPRDDIRGPVTITEVMPDSPAARAGLQPGDRILRINDRPIENLQDVGANISLNLVKDTEIRVQREDRTFVVARVVPRMVPPQGQGATGIAISMDPNQATRYTRQHPIWEAVPLGLRQTFDTLTLFKNGLMTAILNPNHTGPVVVGPVGLAQATGDIARAGIPPLMEWAALLSMNLAIFNLLPIPMLDGGRIVFVLLEWARGGKRVPPEKEGLVHLAGFVLLMTFVAIVSFFDILRIVRGESLFR